MSSLALRVTPREPEPGAETPTGVGQIEHGPSRAMLITPSKLEAGRRYPLITVLHGAGRQDEMLAKAYYPEAEKRQAIFLVPRSVQATWDLIAAGEGRPDLDFLEVAYDLIYTRYPIDFERQGLIGYSDGASYALSIGVSNPHLFRAIMSWAAGFAVYDDTFVSGSEPRPAILMEHGTHDQIFPYEAIALTLRDNLQGAGYRVHFRTDEGGRHWPSGDFQPEALDWFFSDPWHERS